MSSLRPSVSSLRRLGLALSSALLLVVSFPNFNQPWCAWVALVPWLVLLGRPLRLREAFWWSWLIGLLFCLGSMWWLVHVTVFGWVALCAYLAVYFGAFGFAVRVFDAWGREQGARGRGDRAPSTSWRFILLVSSVWVAAEYARSHAFSGFGWNLLAYSQTPAIPLIQMADLTGAWGVSFVIVFVNGCIARAIAPVSPQGRARRQAAWSLGAAALALAISAGYGAWRMRPPVKDPLSRIALVQGSIPQEEKWDEANQGNILDRYEALSRQAAQGAPDLIIWPETSVPGYFGSDEELTQRVFQIARAVARPLLIGAPMLRLSPEGFLLVNSAALVSPEGEIGQRYEKVHLVPWGEFIPLESLLPFLRRMLPPIGDFIPGEAYTVFSSGAPMESVEGQGAGGVGRGAWGVGMRTSGTSPRPPPPFSVLICFEDVFPGLARRFVQAGARLLVVITNDAWFGPTAAAYQHAQASALRAVELRVPVVRAANTGWSGCLDAQGRWGERVHDAQGRELFVPGIASCEVEPGSGQSLYLRFGDWFAWACVLCSLFGLAAAISARQRFAS